MDKMISKVDDNGVSLQVAGDLNYTSYSEIKNIFTDLYELNFPRLVQESANEAKMNLEEFIKTFLQKIKDDEREIIQDSLKNPNSQYLLNSCIKQSARFGKKANLDILSEALKQVLLSNNDDFTSVFSFALELIPQLHKNELLAVLISFYMHCLSFRMDNPIFIEAMTASCMKDYINLGNVSQNQLMHLVSLGVFAFIPFAGDKGITFIERKYPNNPSLLELINQNKATTLRFIVDYYDSNGLVNYQPLSVANVIGFLLIKQNIPNFNIDILK